MVASDGGRIVVECAGTAERYKSIPALIMHRHFKNKVATLVVEMEQQAAKLVDLVHGDRVER